MGRKICIMLQYWEGKYESCRDFCDGIKEIILKNTYILSLNQSRLCDESSISVPKQLLHANCEKIVVTNFVSGFNWDEYLHYCATKNSISN